MPKQALIRLSIPLLVGAAIVVAEVATGNAFGWTIVLFLVTSPAVLVARNVLETAVMLFVVLAFDLFVVAVLQSG